MLHLFTHEEVNFVKLKTTFLWPHSKHKVGSFALKSRAHLTTTAEELLGFLVF